ncbi:nascent polypeptide-associated complex, alpha subunit [Basidiobolus meristosporus CBS 931.73]|uniref:Nascent polypeptide-associated complex subunit alpha n=1 Tax=Basidiobolus meristosporus CBS 931.73 TaxID=1314790 RepID=A0A1Y1Z4D9_9FUNG|nr:nascent polypeptide-associated complex, alpha subunit [Basidiobolus meristosporus CBS 931.73]|eukprot:ORY04857.1 nascent polypeptide-associated complex, alpha subunit [Basidiobolus meristosporus CBS 931.73]
MATTEQQPTVEEVVEDVKVEEIDSDVEGETNADQTIHSRTEKKARKAMAKLGLKPVDGINRVTFCRPRNILFVIAQPEVYKSGNSDTYVVFGECKIEDLNAAAKAAAAQQLAAEQAAAAQAETAVEAAPAAEEAEEEEDVDEEGVEAKDIELVMQQANVSRGKAVKALKANKGDIVNAIMELTM